MRYLSVSIAALKHLAVLVFGGLVVVGPAMAQTFPTNTVLTANSSSLVVGQSVTLTSTTQYPGGGGLLPSRTVDFFDGATKIASVTASSGGSAAVATVTVPSSNGFSTIGSHYYTATWNGCKTWLCALPSTSAVVPVAVKYASSISLSASPINAQRGQTVSLTASVKAVGTTAVPSGTVTFYDGGTTLGSAVAVDAKTGLATAQLVSPVPGLHSLSVSYSGDANNVPSRSGTISETVAVNSVETIVRDMLMPPSVMPQGSLFGRWTSAGISTPSSAAIHFLAINQRDAAAVARDSAAANANPSWTYLGPLMEYRDTCLSTDVPNAQGLCGRNIGWNNIVSWTNAFPGPNNSATNTTIEVRNAQVYVLRSNNTWTQLAGTELNPAGQKAYPSGCQEVWGPAPSPCIDGNAGLGETVTADGLGVLVTPKLTNNNTSAIIYELWNPCSFCDPIHNPGYPDAAGDILAVYATVQARLVTKDPSKAADTDAAAEFYVQNGFDWYQHGITPTGAWNADPSLMQFDGGVGRMKKVTRDWQAFNVMTLAPPAAQTWALAQYSSLGRDQRYLDPAKVGQQYYVPYQAPWSYSSVSPFVGTDYLLRVSCLPSDVYAYYTYVQADGYPSNGGLAPGYSQCASGESPSIGIVPPPIR